MRQPELHSLDIEDPVALEAYLRRTGRWTAEDRPVCTVLTGGVSNRVVLVERVGGPDWVLKQALPKLRVAVDWFSSPERIGREALGLRWLSRLTPPARFRPWSSRTRQSISWPWRPCPDPI